MVFPTMHMEADIRKKHKAKAVPHVLLELLDVSS